MARLSVNGVDYDVDCPPEMPLLWAIRDLLGLTGTKFGCGRGLCGACTVHIDGRAQRSCISTVGSAAEKKITTIEGLSSDGSHPLQRAWESIGVPQCGYCQAGQIMTAAALLTENPAPTDEEIDSGMAGTICRCGTYLRIRRAIRMAADEPAA